MLRHTLFICVLALCLPTLGLNAAAPSQPGKPKIIALKFHADWCGSCQKMGDSFTYLRDKFDGKAVLFTTLDQTNLSKKRQTELLIAAMGLSDVWQQHKGTGFILLLDGKSHKVLKKITAAESFKQMAAHIENQLKALS